MLQTRKRLLCLLLAACLPAAAGSAPPPAGAIVDGERVVSTDAPWAASLMVARRGRLAHHCTATVIGPRRLATARHCIERGDAWRRVVVTGTDDPERRAGSRARVKRVWTPVLIDDADPWARVGDQDLAIVETVGDLRVPALALTAPGTALAPAEPVQTYGFGYTNGEDDSRSGPSLLRRAQLWLSTPEQCTEASVGAAAAALCATRSPGPGGGGLSNGDSGGGLVRQGAAGPELLGVNSSTPLPGPLAGHVNGFASIPALHAFATAPERGYELPIPRERARLSGSARVGARLRCTAAMTPKPRLRTVSWVVTPGRGEERTRITSGAWRVPASARGARISCAVYGGHTEYFGSQSVRSRAVAVRG